MTLYILLAIIGGVLSLTGLIFFSILRLRYKSARAKKRRLQAFSKFEPLLWDLMADQIHPNQFSSQISPNERGSLQEFLLPYLESLRGEAHDKLIAVVQETGLVQLLLQQAQSTEEWKQARGIFFLGLIREQKVLELLDHGLTSNNVFWFYPSVIALARNGLLSFPKVIETLKNRTDWTEHLAISILAEFGVGVCPALLATLSQGEKSLKIQQLAIAVLAHFGYQGSEPILRDYIRFAEHRELRIRALRAWSLLQLGFFDGIAQAMEDHDWGVRAAAVTALGSSQAVNEAMRARPLLRDESWWVRLRAAQAMKKLGARSEIYALLDNPLEDRYAQDMLRYVLENEGGATCAIPNLNLL